MYICKKRQKLSKKNVYSKAQTSFFVIIGLIMLIAVILGFFVYNNIRTSKIKEEAKISELRSQAEEIGKFVNDCIRKAVFDGLQRLGQTGGYLDVPKLISFKGIAIWNLEQANIQPFLNQTQERLLEHIDANVPACVDEEKIKALGFGIEKGGLKTAIEFGNADVTVKTFYPIKLSKEGFTKEFSEFFNTFDIRYRAVFEAATEVNKRTFDEDFDAKNPLKKMGYIKNLDFDVAYKMPETDMMLFTVTDKRSITPENQFYTFSFAAKLGRSNLKKITDLQSYSASNPTFLPFTIFSVDKRAQLGISAGTTISLNGKDVPSISVQQAYPEEVVTKDVPVYKKNAEVIQKQDILYVIDNPVYTFEPTGILFNKFQKLTIYYPPDADDSKGVGILMGKKGFWVPIPSTHEPQYKRVFSNILGFTEFTAVNCASQKLKTTIAEHFFEPSPPCFIFSVLGVIMFALTIYLGIVAGVSPFSSLLKFDFAILGEAIAKNLVSFGFSSFTALGATFVSLFVISTAGSILGATTDVFYGKSPENCETFYPICDQNINIIKTEKDGSGECIPDSGARVAAGAPMNVCAQVEKCDALSKFFCKPCSVKCSAQFY